MVPLRNQSPEPSNHSRADPFWKATCSVAAAIPKARAMAREKINTATHEKKLAWIDARKTATPAKRYNSRLTRFPAKAEMELRMTSSAGAVEVVMRTSSVPVCCASCTELKNDWALITKKV